jgi:hypothetical protein
MSQEIRHFLVFVEQDRSLGRPLADDLVPLPLSSALEDHFGARLGERLAEEVSPNDAAGGVEQAPLVRPSDPGRG